MKTLRFWLNDEEQVLDGPSPTTTVLRYLRDQTGLTGTKEGCAEGDCGACTVAVLEPAADGRGALRSVNSCLLLLPMVQGKRLYTVEGIQDGQRPHPVQTGLADKLGSQCGYCTPGIVMALFEACYRSDFDEPWKMDAQMCGNLCRCTGYRPIREAAQALGGLLPKDRFSALQGAPVPTDMGLSYSAGEQRFFTPTRLEELWPYLDRDPAARFVVGGTDLSLEVTKRYAEPPSLISLEGLSELRVLSANGGHLSIGSTVTLTELEDFARGQFPPMERMLRYFGARQIKNRATVGGNLCTASPIGDLAPVFLAFDAQLVLVSKAGERNVPIRDFFLGYRKTALRPGELLARVEVGPWSPATRASAYKVSKRRELDISTVAACFCLELHADGTVKTARLAYGGMAATPARALKAEAALKGQPWTVATVEVAAAALGEDFRPLSDHRGTAAYRKRVAQNLLLGFFEETQATPMPRLPHAHTATVEAG